MEAQNNRPKRGTREDYGQILEKRKGQVDKLKRLAIDNLAMSLVIMELLDDPVQIKTITSLVSVPEATVQDALSHKLENLIADSRLVVQEMDDFFARIANAEKPDSELAPFLKQIWSGEMYGSTKYDALADLTEDIGQVGEFLLQAKSNLNLLAEHKIPPEIVVLPHSSLVNPPAAKTFSAPPAGASIENRASPASVKQPGGRTLESNARPLIPPLTPPERSSFRGTKDRDSSVAGASKISNPEQKSSPSRSKSKQERSERANPIKARGK